MSTTKATPQRLVELMAAKAGFLTEVNQSDDGSGYSVLITTTPHGEFNVTIDSEFWPNCPAGRAERRHEEEQELAQLKADQRNPES
jgi:hypothetical protein